MNEYIFGNVVTIQTSFRDVNSILVDPTNVYLVVNKAGESVTQYQFGVGSVISKIVTGTYSASFPLDIVGGWNYFWFSSGTIASDNGQFVVLPSGV